MSGTVKGIILEIGGDTSGLQKALKKVNSATSSLSKELRGINSLLKLDPKNTELLAQKQTILNENIETTKDKLNQLKKIKNETDKKIAEGTEISKENYRALQREIINTEKKLNNLTENLKQFNFENSKWTKAGKKVEEYGDKISKVGEKIDKVGNKTAVITAGVVAGGTAMTTSAMEIEDAVAKYASTTNIAIEETEKYKQVLEDISNDNYGESYEDIADSMSQVKMQLKNINDSDLKNITEKAIALRDLFGYDVSESIRAVKAMMDNFNISADEAFNLIAEGKKQGLDFSNEMLDNVNEYSVQFKKLGLTADDMFNIFKTGAENGAFNLDKIGDAVKEFSIRAIDGSNTTIEGFKKIGLNANDMAKKFASGGDIAKKAFIEVIQKIGKMNNKVEQSIVGVDLFGTMWEDLGPTVITSFDKMDNGISKRSDSMQKSIDELYNTTKKKAEAQLRRLKGLGADFGKEMLPTLEKLIDKAEKFVDSLQDMSDEEKDNIVKIAMLVAGIGPLTKAVGTAGKAIGTTTKGIGIFSEAVALMGKTSTDAFNKASSSTQTLAKGLTFLTSPAGLATVAITATAGALIYFATKQTEAQKKAKELAEEMANSKQSLEEYNQNIDKTTSANLAQIDSTSKLKDELVTLVDENGKVKEGYESRVSFILNELNKALGTEYSLNGDIVQSYKDLQNEIDSTIEKKKAQIKLNAEEEKYKNAIEKQQEAVENLRKAQEEYQASAKQFFEEHFGDGTSYDQAFEKLKKGYMEAGYTAEAASKYAKEWMDYNGCNLKKACEDAEWQVKEYTNNVKDYEEDYAKFTEGKYSEIGNAIKASTEDWTTKSLEEINKSIVEQEKVMQQYKQIYENTGNEVALQLSQQAQQNLNNLTQELVKRTQTLTELGPQEIEAWKKIASESYSSYSEEVSKMAPEMQQKIQEATGIIAGGTPQMQAAAGELGRKTVEEFDKSTDSKQKALNTITGYLNGLSDEQKREFLKQAGIENADIVLDELNKGNLSEENGKNILEGLWRGLKNNTWKEKIIGVASGLAQAVNKAFTGKDGWDEHSPSKKMKKFAEYYIQPISDVMKKRQNSIVATAQSLASKVNSTMTNKLNIPLNNYKELQEKLNNKMVNSTKTVFTTPQIVFNVQELDEAKLQQCFNYVNRKFGSQY